MNIIPSDIDFESYITIEDKAFVKPAYEFIDGALERLHKGVAVYGSPMPWSKTQEHFRFRPAEITIWAGVNGNGKSLVSGMVAAWLAKRERVMIASMEMPPEATVARMLRQTSGTDQPSRQFAERFREVTDWNLFIYDQVGSVKAKKMLGVVHYAATLGIKHIFIDSLVKCGIGTEDYNSQKRFVDDLCAAAKEHKLHIHLIHHVRKGNSETDVPDKFDIKGAGEITDLADNVLIVARNQKKDQQKRTNSQQYNETDPDGFLRVAKQRHGEWEGMWGFWFHEKSHQWSGRPNEALSWELF